MKTRATEAHYKSVACVLTGHNSYTFQVLINLTLIIKEVHSPVETRVTEFHSAMLQTSVVHDFENYEYAVNAKGS